MCIGRSYLSQIFIWSLLVVAGTLCQAKAQSYGSPFFVKSSAPTKPRPTKPWKINGVVLETGLTFPAHLSAVEGWEVDGDEKNQVLHWMLMDRENKVAFLFNVLVHPLPGTNKVSLTLTEFTQPLRGPFEVFDRSYRQVPLPVGQTSVEMEQGETRVVTLLPTERASDAYTASFFCKAVLPAATTGH